MFLLSVMIEHLFCHKKKSQNYKMYNSFVGVRQQTIQDPWSQEKMNTWGDPCHLPDFLPHSLSGLWHMKEHPRVQQCPWDGDVSKSKLLRKLALVGQVQGAAVKRKSSGNLHRSTSEPLDSRLGMNPKLCICRPRLHKTRERSLWNEQPPKGAPGWK